MILSLFAALSTVAGAAPACTEPLTEARLEAALDEANAAIRAADVGRHQAVVEALEAAIPCLEIVPRAEQWAEVLVGIAIVAYSLGEEWEAPLATALTIHPRVNRMVGLSHEIASWEPPPRPEPSDEIAPEGVRVFYDGEIVTRIPATGGWHLVQRRDGDGLQSLLLRDAPIPPSWLVAPALESKRRDLGWGFVAVGSGAASRGQRPDLPGDFLPEQAETRATVVVGGHGWLRLVGPVGVRFDAAASLLAPSVDASIGPSWSSGPVTVGLGAGARTMTASAGGDERSFLLAWPAVHAAFHPTTALTLSADGGWAPAITHGRVRGDYAFGQGALRGTVGLEARLNAARFELAGVSGRELPVTVTEIGAHAGLRWGKVR